MYTEVAISAIKERIGWSEVQSSDHSLTLSSDNKKAESGRYFDSFHALCTIENIYEAIPTVNMQLADFNVYLSSIRSQHAAKVLTAILNQNEQYNNAVNYDQVVLDNIHLFDEPLGYSVAASIIELFISTSRNNFRERNAKMAYDKLKIELEGARNERGIKVAAGIKDRYQIAVKTATNIIFPNKITVDSKPIW